MSGPTVRELARVADPVLRRLAGIARRLTVSVTSSPIWKLIGTRALDGTNEVIEAEAFSGVGFYARPRSSGGTPEAVVVNVGDARAPVVVATRDERTCKAVRDALGGVAAGEAIVYTPNGEAVIQMKASGVVEVKSPDGTAVALATKAELQSLRDWVAYQFAATGGHIHTVVGGATTSMVTVATAAAAPTPSVPPTPTGTSVLRGQ